MTTKFRADNIGSLCEVEDRSILIVEMQKAAGVDVFTDGEYRRGNFMADFTNTLDGMVPSESIMAPIWRGANRELARDFRRLDGAMVVGAKLRRKTPGVFREEAAFLKQHSPGPFKVCVPRVVQFDAGSILN